MSSNTAPQDNHFITDWLDSALRWPLRIRNRLGTVRAERWTTWWRDNISGQAAMWRRVRSHPLSFVWPPREATSSDEAG